MTKMRDAETEVRARVRAGTSRRRTTDHPSDGAPAGVDERLVMSAAPRRIGRGIVEALGAVPLFVTAPLYRHWHLRWGAAHEEIGGEMPGDELVPKAAFNATRAITIDAPPELVWPWIVQMGHGRAGFYSYDLLDNAGNSSAERVLAEYQQPQVGDWMPMAKRVNETTAHRVKAFEPNEWMLWAKPDSSWAWKLVPLEANRTRLVVRLKQHYNWKSPGQALLAAFLMEVGDPPMMRRSLRGIKQRAEGLHGGEENE